jgi:hypothetical protein
VLTEIFNAHAVGHSIPPQSIKTALEAAGADVSIAEELLRCNTSGIDYNDFKRAALSPSPLEMWANSIPLASILADALPISSQDPLRRISVLSAEEIACIAEGVGAALKQVLASKVESLHQVYVRLDEQTRSQTHVSKFQVPLFETPTCFPPPLPVAPGLYSSSISPYPSNYRLSCLLFPLPNIEKKGGSWK